MRNISSPHFDYRAGRLQTKPTYAFSTVGSVRVCRPSSVPDALAPMTILLIWLISVHTLDRRVCAVIFLTGTCGFWPWPSLITRRDLLSVLKFWFGKCAFYYWMCIYFHPSECYSRAGIGVRRMRQMIQQNVVFFKRAKTAKWLETRKKHQLLLFCTCPEIMHSSRLLLIALLALNSRVGEQELSAGHQRGCGLSLQCPLTAAPQWFVKLCVKRYEFHWEEDHRCWEPGFKPATKRFSESTDTLGEGSDREHAHCACSHGCALFFGTSN